MIQERLKAHLADSTDNVALLLGDLNSTWGTTAIGGCHKGTEQWATTVALRNPLQSLSLQQAKPIYTHWMAKHIGNGAEHIGYSWNEPTQQLHKYGKIKSFLRAGTRNGSALNQRFNRI